MTVFENGTSVRNYYHETRDFVRMCHAMPLADLLRYCQEGRQRALSAINFYFGHDAIVAQMAREQLEEFELGMEIYGRRLSAETKPENKSNVTDAEFSEVKQITSP